ncbi:MAG: hypothetical protein GX610_12510 [Rhodococcus sp.]|nr:hypothetical protein [Rhodococcus sp. (in: high G+C Gram-positive bacteria)]
MNARGTDHYRPIAVRETLSAAAVLMSGALAAFVLTNPRSRSWAVYASDRELDRWLSSQPTGVVVGMVLAVITLAGLQRSGSRRIASVLAALCVALLAGAHWIVSEIDTIDTLIALHFAKTAAAGFLLGASVALAWGFRARQIALVLGVSAAYVLAGIASPARGDTEYLEPATMSTSAIGEPSWLLLAAAFVLSVAAAAVATKDVPTQPLEQSTILAALGGSLALALTNRVLGAWIVDQEFGTGARIATVVAVSLAVVLVVTVIVARSFPDADGVFVLATTAIAAGAITVINDLRDPIVTVHPWLSLAVGVVAVASGMLLPARARLSGVRRTILGIAIVAVVPLVATIAPEFGNDGPFLLVRLAVLGIGVGLTVGGCVPRWAPTAALGLALPFGSLVFAAATTIPLSRVVTVSDSVPFELIASTSLTPARLTGAAMFLTVVVCGLFAARLRPRPVTTASSEPHPEDSADTPPPETP